MSKVLVLLSALSLVLSSCSRQEGILSYAGSVRPVVKIGLVAPFEGLYRPVGYEALTAMRQAIHDVSALCTTCPQGAVPDLLPLALDSGLSSHSATGTPGEHPAVRAVSKMLADETVSAVVGPLQPQAVHAVGVTLNLEQGLWYVPFLPVEPVGGALESGLTSLAEVVARDARAMGVERLVVAGWVPGWPQWTEEVWSDKLGLPVRLDDDPAAVVPGEGVVWLGNMDAAASFWKRLTASSGSALPGISCPANGDQRACIPMWLLNVGVEHIFAPLVEEKLQRWDDDRRVPVYVVANLDEGYHDWAAENPPASPFAYQVYRASASAIATATDQPFQQPEPRTMMFQLTADGRLVLADASAIDN